MLAFAANSQLSCGEVDVRVYEVQLFALLALSHSFRRIVVRKHPRTKEANSNRRGTVSNDSSYFEQYL